LKPLFFARSVQCESFFHGLLTEKSGQFESFFQGANESLNATMSVKVDEDPFLPLGRHPWFGQNFPSSFTIKKTRSQYPDLQFQTIAGYDYVIPPA